MELKISGETGHRKVGLPQGREGDAGLQDEVSLLARVQPGARELEARHHYAGFPERAALS